VIRGSTQLIAQMSGRDPLEAHRVATPLELLFDLTFATSFALSRFGASLKVDMILSGCSKQSCVLMDVFGAGQAPPDQG
jgi:hypothetical protein